jgi:hypothetical protein
VVGKATEAVSATGFGLNALDEAELDQLTAILRKLRIHAGDFPG